MRKLNLLQIVEMQEELNNLYVPGWRYTLTPAHYMVQVIDEMSELFGSGVEYKWWKNVEYSEYDEWNAKIEMIDILFFVASIISIQTPEHVRSSIASNEMKCWKRADLRVIKEGTNQLDHENVAKLVKSVVTLATEKHKTVISTAETVHRIVGSMGFDEEEICAMYAAKYALNKFRISSDYKSGKYVKVIDGIEDNQRLKIVVDDFLNNPEKTLDDVQKEVSEMFFALKGDK